ncbi:MAG: FmdE family protein [Archaeoglobaceae archaeon]|nr:FmdE family protein [Archaeoglobaceae archaeon]
MSPEVVDFAIRLHGHLSPGIALGIRMAETAYKNLGIKFKGKGLIGIAETSMCLPDALQAVIGTTVGNRNLIVADYGKLALSVVRADTLEGYRVSLRKEAINKSELMKKFLLREGKLNEEEEFKLAQEFLSLENSFFNVKKIRLKINPEKKKEGIFECKKCGELLPLNYLVEKGDEKICIPCSGDSYFEWI